MKKKNLIFFLPEFVKGGAGNSIFSLCKNLNKKNFNLNILCLHKCEYKYELSSIAKVYEIKKRKTIFAQREIARIISQISKSQYKTIFISNLFHANVLIGLFQKKQNNINQSAEYPPRLIPLIFIAVTNRGCAELQRPDRFGYFWRP